MTTTQTPKKHKFLTGLALLMATGAVMSIFGIGHHDNKSQPSAAYSTPSDSFLARVRSDLPQMASNSDAKLLTVGRNTCEVFRTAPSVRVAATGIAQMVLDRGYDVDTFATLVGDSVAHLCPEYLSDLANLKDS
jgi:hypothetical protein